MIEVDYYDLLEIEKTTDNETIKKLILRPMHKRLLHETSTTDPRAE